MIDFNKREVIDKMNDKNLSDEILALYKKSGQKDEDS